MARLARIAILVAVGVALIAGAALAVSSRGSEELNPVPAAGRCGGVTREPLDSRSLQHVLPDTPPPTFTSDQPTSGPHSPVVLAGVQPQSLTPVQQVGLLEEGSILLQHQGLDGPAQARLESLAGPDVVVAPGRNLPDAVVATAWTVRLRCAGVEVAALRSFIDRFEGIGLG